MREALTLIFGITFAAIALVLVAGFVVAPRSKVSSENVFKSLEADHLVLKSIALDYPQGLSLATRSNQLPESLDITVCDLGFDYCFFYVGNQNATNTQDKLGLRINVAGNKDEASCLESVSFGAKGLQPEILKRENYGTSIIGPLTLVAGERESYGYIYRIYVENNCYELETRLIQRKGASGDKSSLSQLNDVIGSVSIKSTGKVVFPGR